MRFALKSADELAAAIRRRAIAIAADEGDTIDPPPPALQRLREPRGLGVHWTLADYQNDHGLPYIQVTAAEASAQWDLAPE
jgi:hypothetical protein